ncbi:ADP-ribosylglycohydrolase family protein [Cellulomonas soli]|uniref:ADP-ribosylglycohydrolase n=1 Tax=Cellulomonas soli TaxID=931535 RepID=A0A512P8F4_9CELL|nr:ADP-ribosylglycohydrolase family protein [Cellulomonas soli]NYI57705.1 ADP-ribosylglycohydrolase [Cellulomonas soli]GEP67485.1 hypothetical protein CSO01_02000 [Cellulomonas soli]
MTSSSTPDRPADDHAADHAERAAQAGAGTLLASACGDALGVPYEMSAVPAGPALMIGGGLGPYAPGEWSDDTQMAVCVARVAASGADLRTRDALDAVALAFEGWIDAGATDVGIQTAQVLRRSRRLPGRPAERLAAAARALHAETGRTAGNGALMRTGPVGVAALDDREATAQAARLVAELTHTDPLAGESCVLWCEAIRVAATEQRLDAAAGLDLLPPERRDDWAAWIAQATAPGAAPGLRPNGFTVTALQAAWHAIATTHDEQRSPTQNLEDGLQAAVHLGGDTDTVAAIAGALLGARWGVDAVPAVWRAAVHGWPGLTGEDLVSTGRTLALTGLGHGLGD